MLKWIVALFVLLCGAFTLMLGEYLGDSISYGCGVIDVIIGGILIFIDD